MRIILVYVLSVLGALVAARADDRPLGALPTEEEYLDWAKAFAAEDGEAYDKADLNAVYQLSPYAVAFEVLEQCSEEVDSYWKIELKAQVARADTRVQPEIDRLKAHIKQDKDALAEAFKAPPAPTDQNAIDSLRQKFAYHIANERAAISALQEAFKVWKAAYHMRNWASNPQHNEWRSRVRFLHGKLLEKGNQLIGAGTFRPDNSVLNSDLARINEIYEGTISAPKEDFTDPNGPSFTNWATGLENAGAEIQKNFIDDFWINTEEQKSVQAGIHLISMTVAVADLIATIPQAYVSLQAFFSSIKATEDGIFALVPAGAGQFGGPLTYSGGTISITCDITRIEELQVLLITRALPAANGAFVAYSIGGNSGAKPVGGGSFWKSSSGPFNCKSEPYPKIKVAGSDELVPVPTKEQIRGLKIQKPSPAFPDAAREAFKVHWQTKLNQVVPKGFSSWENFWSKVNIHHIIPRSLGGGHEVENLVPVLIEDANGVKQHQQLTTWWLKFLTG